MGEMGPGQCGVSLAQDALGHFYVQSEDENVSLKLRTEVWIRASDS